MVNTIQEITDADLLTKIRESQIADEQKKELEGLIPEMNGEERNDLLSIIEHANAAGAETEKNMDPEALKALNEKYTKEMDQLVKESNETARKEFEKLQNKEEVGQMKALESEIATTESVNINQTDQIKKTKSHTGLKFLLFLIILIGLGIGAVYLLQNL